jgi:YHS domain-containing protein
MKVVIAVLSLMFVGALAGCGTAPQANAGVKPGAPHAECLVCKANADLACVDIPVDASTPTYTQDGKTYYFCSNECRSDFVKDPAKYAAAAKK